MSKKKLPLPPDPPKTKNSPLYGFPTGRVAKTIRKIISPHLSDHDVECISVVLVSHLMLEERINILIYKWLTKQLPRMGGKRKQGLSVNDIATEMLNKYIKKLDFIKKLDLIEPLGKLLWKDDSDAIFKDIKRINNARVEIAHRLNINTIKIGKELLATEKGIEHFLELAQQRLLNISDLIEFIKTK